MLAANEVNTVGTHLPQTEWASSDFLSHRSHSCIYEGPFLRRISDTYPISNLSCEHPRANLGPTRLQGVISNSLLQGSQNDAPRRQTFFWVCLEEADTGGSHKTCVHIKVPEIPSSTCEHGRKPPCLHPRTAAGNGVLLAEDRSYQPPPPRLWLIDRLVSQRALTKCSIERHTYIMQMLSQTFSPHPPLHV